MKKNCYTIIFGLLCLAMLDSCEWSNESNATFESVKIRRIISHSNNYIDTISYEYDDNDLLIKGKSSGGNFFVNYYDSINRLIRTNRYNTRGLYHYFTYQYDSNAITVIRYQYYTYSDRWGGYNEKSVYCYDSKDQCEQMDYYKKEENGNWIKSDDNTICSWYDDNLIEMRHSYGDSIDYIESYQYDNKSNPEKLLAYIILPWTKSKNNPIYSSIQYSDGRKVNTSFNYTYNRYGYPIKKERIDNIGTTTEEFEYEFK